MNSHATKLSSEELKRRREDIRRGLFRVNSAVVAIVVVVVVLALAGIFAAYRASRHARQARAATELGQEELWKSYLAQATAGRLSGLMGRKTAGQEAITAAARIRPSLELRNEAIAHLALTDLTDQGYRVESPTDGGLTFDADLARYAITYDDGFVRVFQIEGQKELFQWREANGRIDFVRFSPDGRYLAVKYFRSDLFVLDLKERSRIFRGPAQRGFDFTGDGSRFAVLSDDKLMRLFETSSGKEILPPLLFSQNVDGWAFHPTEQKLAVVNEAGVQIWNWATKQKLERLEHNARITVMAWQGSYLAVGDGKGELEAWDLAAKTSKRWVGHRAFVSDLFFNHRGDLLVSSSYDGSCRVWNPQTGNLLSGTTKGFGKAFSRDDTRLGYVTLSTGGRGAWGWWQVEIPQRFRTLSCADGSDGNVWHFDFSPDGRLLAVIKRDGLRLFDFATGQQILRQRMVEARSAFFLPDGKNLVTCGDNRVSLWPLEGGSDTRKSAHLGRAKHIALPETGHVDSARMSADRRRIALPLTDTDAALIDLEHPEQIVMFQNGSYPKLPAMSPDGKWVVTGTFHGRGTVVWDAVTGKKVLDLDQGNANPFFSPDGRVLVAAGDKEYRIFESASWKLRCRISTDSPSDLANYAAFSNDGRLLSIVKQLQLVQLIDPQTWTVLASLTPPEPRIITWLSFSSDNSILAAATSDDVIQVWDLRRIRQDLAAMGLDWKEPDAGPGPNSGLAHATPASVGGAASSQFMTLVGAGVALVMFCGWFVLQRQQRLFAQYVEVDQLNEERNRELEKAQTAIMHSQKMRALGTLAAGIAHDFNNLLSVIRMSNKLIGREARGNPEIEENVAEVEQAVQQGKSVVRSMLGYSREHQDENGQLSLPDLVDDIVGLLSKEFLSGITLNLELDRDTPPIEGSRARLEQILLNLIVNAAEAMDRKGNLRIAVGRRPTAGDCSVRLPRPGDHYVELVVADSGPGIEPDILPRIFEPFFTTKSVGATRGTGLGLSMVHTMAEEDGLGIGVETVLGAGTTFRIVIPVKTAEKKS